jgi:hypothetical protein
MAPGNRIKKVLFSFILELPVTRCDQHKAGASGVNPYFETVLVGKPPAW